METLKLIISTLQGISTVLATIAFTVIVIKIVIEPETRHKQIKVLRNVLIAFVLVILTFSIIEIPQYYYGTQISIVDSEFAEMTFADIKDKDVQGRETINIDGKWYVVTDTNQKLGALTGDSKLSVVTNFGLYSSDKVVENVSVLRKFSECQGFFKGYYAEIYYYRNEEGLIFSANTTYDRYIEIKNSNQNNLENTGVE